MKTARSLRTTFSKDAADFASRFKLFFANVTIGPLHYTVDMTQPEGPSTGSGVQALQRLRLVPRKAGGAAIVFGSLNKPGGTAEIRAYEHLSAIHEARFKEPLPLDRAQYVDLLGKIDRFFAASSVKVTTAERPAQLDLRSEDDSGARGGRGPIAVGVGLAVLAAAAGALWWTGFLGR